VTADAAFDADHLSLEALRRIDELSARFEAAWDAGATPRIEDYLEGVQEPERTALFRELLLAERELRKERSAPQEESAYRARFPQYSALIRTLFQESDSAGGAHDNALGFLQPSTGPGALGRLGHFDVLEVLGQGGFGIVLRAFDDVLQRVVAIKVLTGQAGATASSRKRFLREARSGAVVRHDNVVQVYTVAEQPRPYLVMEYVAGETLQQRVDRTGPLDVHELLRLGQQLASGLAAAHAQGVIHRDVKPANILLAACGFAPDAKPQAAVVKITDFGLARTVGEASLTQSGIIAGTPAYMSPEQAEGTTIDHRGDLFSLGSVLYFMCTGQPPFAGATALAVLRHVVDHAPRPIQEIVPAVPRRLVDLIARLHAKKPAERFQSADEVADLLGRYLAALQGQDPKCADETEENEALPRSCRPAPPGPTVIVAAPRRRRPRTTAAVAALLLALAGLVLTEATGVTGIGSTVWRLVARQNLAQAPFDANQARAYQDAWAEQLGTQVVTTNSLGMELALIPAGTFVMGAAEGEPDRGVYEVPRHEVVLTRPFRMGVCPVTVGQFREFVTAKGYQTEAESSGKGATVFQDDTWQVNPSASWKDPGFEQADGHPVVCVSWDDARAFCAWLSEKEGKEYTLPTEAQWEYACRAGTQTVFSFGDDEHDLAQHAWYRANSHMNTHAVRQKKPNAWGLYDMHGHVWQWTADWLGGQYYEHSPRANPTGPRASNDRVLRGGDWSCAPGQVRSAFRGFLPPTERKSNGGFRVVCEPSP
jgi:formylglycine-generating enzyme required for sulfatase activity